MSCRRFWSAPVRECAAQGRTRSERFVGTRQTEKCRVTQLRFATLGTPARKLHRLLKAYTELELGSKRPVVAAHGAQFTQVFEQPPRQLQGAVTTQVNVRHGVAVHVDFCRTLAATRAGRSGKT